MKRFFLLTVLAGSMATVAKSQQYEYAEPTRGGSNYNNWRIGVFFAPNVSWMKPTSNKSNDKLFRVSSEGNRVGYSWGLMVDRPFAENYGVATGIQLTTTGGKILSRENTDATPPTVANRVTSAYFDYKLQFVEVPLALKLRSDEVSNGVHVFGQLGLSLGLNISKKASFEVTYTDASDPSGLKTVSGDNEKIFDGLAIAPAMLSLNLGGGIEYDISDKMALTVGLFFNNGFAPDITNPAQLDMGYKGKFADGNVRLNNLALRVGIFF
ncbi:porin family protein [Polluticoccus soli]|uniref:porin family protein n=1 Tax=Polluticoccus soli TaxID=3034150 RepID=UPI0023E2B514|nr:porin family protein [Flavipsychrobacter sp. JY13-12]